MGSRSGPPSPQIQSGLGPSWHFLEMAKTFSKMAAVAIDLAATIVSRSALSPSQTSECPSLPKCTTAKGDQLVPQEECPRYLAGKKNMAALVRGSFLPTPAPRDILQLLTEQTWPPTCTKPELPGEANIWSLGFTSLGKEQFASLGAVRH